MPDYPILEFDNTDRAIIEPGTVCQSLKTMPERLVLCFFQDVIRGLHEGDDIKSEIIYQLGSEIGNNPVYILEQQDGQQFAVLHPGVGAPLAAAFLEEAIALGAKKIVACGGAGVLNGDLAVGHVVVPSSAVRDEGTSYHYLPPGREVAPSPEAVTAIEAALEAHNVPYVKGKTWTTDAIYRETPTKIKKRRDEGCLTVEMEAAAFFAVAQFRGVSFGQLLYSGDNLDGEVWDSRNWHRQASTREKLFWLSVEAVLRL